MKNFRFQIIIRVVFLLLTCLVISYFTFGDYSLIIIIVSSVLCIIQTHRLFKFVDITNREISRLLQSIKYSDFTQQFSNENLGSSFKELNESIKDVISKFHQTKKEKQEHLLYLQTVMMHVGIGLLTFNDSGEVVFINNTAKKLLKLPFLKNIEDLDKSGNRLANELRKIKTGEKKIVNYTTSDEVHQLILYSTEFKVGSERFTLVSIQNIQSELEENEMDAWQKLIRVLTHEIMNSVTPISSLAGTVDKMISETLSENKSFSEETKNDIHAALRTIEKRSEGLIEFVAKYRSLAKIPKPEFEKISVLSLFDNISSLMSNEISQSNIELSVKVLPTTITINADPKQFEQVILNLFINAIQAAKEKEFPKIELLAYYDSYRRVNIIVKDNGKGISKEIQEKIFVPFFTTKSEGSGIGLSLSRQIIRAHGGTIRVNSKENTYTSLIINL